MFIYKIVELNIPIVILFFVNKKIANANPAAAKNIEVKIIIHSKAVFLISILQL